MGIGLQGRCVPRGIVDAHAAYAATLATEQDVYAGQDPNRSLVGDTFTLADLTMASMLSPWARPSEHPFYPRMAFGKTGDQWVEQMRSSRMVAWVHRCYEKHRRR
jgi:glutathione S-transferase